MIATSHITPAVRVLDAAKVCLSAYKECTWENGGDTQALVRVFGETVVLAFRGTEFNISDILRDLRAVPWSDPLLGFCHSGFLKGARGVWPMIREVAMRPGLPVVVTGHSLGGALAAITAGFMVVEGKQPAGLVTFGAPRPGFRRLATILDGVPTWRVVNGADFCPSHPWPIWGYVHPGPELRLTNDGPGSILDRWQNHKLSDYIFELRQEGRKEHEEESEGREGPKPVHPAG